MGFDCPGISRLSVLRTHYHCDDALEKVTRMLEREQRALAVCPALYMDLKQSDGRQLSQRLTLIQTEKMKH